MPRGNFHRLKWLVPLAAVLCAAMVAGFWLARSRYECRLAEQIRPVVAPEIVARSSPPSTSVPTVLLLGDSRMAQWELPQLSGWRVVNAGASGLTTGQLRLAAPKLLDEFHPAAVVLEAGINDLKYLGLRPEMAPQIVSLAASNLTAVVHDSVARQCRVIVLETWLASRPDLARRLVWNAAIPDSVVSLNMQLRSLNAPEQGIRVVDLFREAGLKPDAASYRDTLHFEPEVYRRLTPALEKDLKALAPQSKPLRD